jgi:hypothetical protein
MAFDLTFSFDPRMLVVRLHGPGDSREGHRAFQDVQGHPEYFQGVPILIDAREVTYRPAPTEARVFTALFATAFPCSLLAIVGSAREYQEATREITQFSVSRGATLAAFTNSDDARGWIAEQSAVLAASDSLLLDTLGSDGRRRCQDGVVIPYALRERIEATHFEVQGHACELRLDSAAGRPLVEPDIAEVTVSTSFEGSARRATADVRVSRLDDEEYVVAAVVTAMRAALAGAGQPRIASASAALR